MISYPSGFIVPEEDIRQEVRSSLLRNSEQVSSIEYMEVREAKIKGSSYELHIYEGHGEHDPPTRMAFTSEFPGKSGEVMILFAGPVVYWDQTTVERFLASVY